MEKVSKVVTVVQDQFFSPLDLALRRERRVRKRFRDDKVWGSGIQETLPVAQPARRWQRTFQGLASSLLCPSLHCGTSWGSETCGDVGTAVIGRN